MAKIKVSKSLIESIASQDNNVYIEKTQNLIRNVISASVQELSEKVSYVTNNNVVLQPVNELLNGAMCDNSQFVYFLGIENAQLELNTAQKTNFWRQLAQRLKFAWKNRRNKKKKKKKANLSELEVSDNQDMEKYAIYDLTCDLQKSIANQLSETSIIYSSNNQLLILGKDDFGSNTKIKIYIVNNNADVYRFYAGKRKGFIDININARCDALNEKINLIGDNFITILKILNVIFYNANGRIANQVFMESVLYSVPNEIFEGDDIYKVFIKIINYLSIKTIKNTMSINNHEKTIFSDEICGNETFAFTKMMDFLSQHD